MKKMKKPQQFKVAFGHRKMTPEEVHKLREEAEKAEKKKGK